MARTPSQRGRYARQRGSGFELEISHQLFDELGIQFRRNLEQVRTAGLGDLLPDSNDFPFSLELKRRIKGVGIPSGAWQQAVQASNVDAGLYPAVIYRYDHRKPRCVVGFGAIVESETGQRVANHHDKADISFPRFCKLTREIMAWRAENEPRNQRDAEPDQAQPGDTQGGSEAGAGAVDLQSARGKLFSALRNHGTSDD